MLSMTALILTIAFLPLALFAATRIHPTLKPPRHRPIVFVLGGTLMLVFGLLAGYTLRRDLASGVIHFTSRYFGEFYASSQDQPLAYWTLALLFYILAVLFAGLGLAGFGLCFSSRHTNHT